MTQAFQMVDRLTRDQLAFGGRRQLLAQFSYEFGWRPSDFFDGGATSDLATSHLLVEHGLTYSAVLSFMRETREATGLKPDERRRLLSVSYNNLVDWHVWVDRRTVSYVYNRTEPPTVVQTAALSASDYSSLDRTSFEAASLRRPTPNLPALDDAFIDSLGRWRLLLAAELDSSTATEASPALFNAILLTRVIEDALAVSQDAPRGILMRLLDQGRELRFSELLPSAIAELTGQEPPQALWDQSALTRFDTLDANSVYEIVSEFYRHSGSPYQYDFSVMSKHALSRIYEKYVAMLRYPASGQASFLSVIPSATRDKSQGAVYTPEFIARFFARYIQGNLPPPIFRKSKVADLACGSGILLRTILEEKINSGSRLSPPNHISEALEGLIGVDIDPNACAAARLSLGACIWSNLVPSLYR